MDDFMWPTPPAWLEPCLPKRIYKDVERDVLDELLPHGHSPAEVRDWLIKACNELHISPSYLARLSGVAASTVNRFLRQAATDTANLTATTIDKIHEVIAREAVFRFAGPLAIQNSFEEIWKRESELIRARNEANHDSHTRSYYLKDSIFPDGPYCYFPRMFFERNAVFRGAINNQHYFDSSDWAHKFDFELTVPMTTRDTAALTAFAVESEDGGGAYANGSVILGRMLCTSKLGVGEGDEVIAFRRRTSDGALNCGIWRLLKDPRDRMWLMPLDERSEVEGLFLGDSAAGSTAAYISHEVVGSINS